MKVIQINSTCGRGSTGKICVAISDLLLQNGDESFIFYSHGNSAYPNGVRFGNRFLYKICALFSRLFGNYGFNSKHVTKKVVKRLKKEQPDVIHLHNLHSHNVNLTILFRYLKQSNAKVVWTFHDCWAFTAYCTYFDMVHCGSWESGCNRCLQRKQTSWISDRSASLFRKKKELFTGLQNLTIVTPSEWLARLVKRSFLKDYPVRIIYNGIDLNVFCSTESDFRARHAIGNDFILLGVAFDWDARKGLDVFLELHKRLPKGYRIVLVGTNDEIDKKLPSGIISIHRTQNQKELAEIYTAADLFVNPTREDNFPTVNLESLACGTPVITFRTGGSPECIDETCGVTVEKDDVDALESEILRICAEKPFSSVACTEHARKFDMNKRFGEYLDLYREVK